MSPLLPLGPGFLAEGFQFHPGSLPWIHLAWLGPVLFLLYLYSFHRKRAALKAFASEAVLSHLIPHVSWARQYFKCGLVLAGILLCVVGLARPQWGTSVEEIRRKGIDLVVLLDLSKSMLAEDVPPNRLEWAKADLSELLGGLSGDRIGLVAFAGRSEIRCPLTFDYGFFRRILSDLKVGSVGLGGTAIGAALHKGLECFQDNVKNHKAILLITDGEDHEAYVTDAADKAKAQGVRIFSIGVGDTGEGQRIPITDEKGNRLYLKDKDGNEVWTKMDPRVLLSAGQITDGGYAPAYLRKDSPGGGVTSVRDIYAKIVEKVTRRELEGAKEERYRDRFQWFLAAAFALLAIEPLVRTRRRLAPAASPTGPSGKVHPGSAGPRPGTADSRSAARRPAGAAAAKLALFGLVWLAPAGVRADEFEKLLGEGNRLYAAGNWAGAEEKYLAARTARQDRAEVPYNIANTYFQREDFQKAIEHYTEALGEARERGLEVNIRYNISCARARESEKFVGDLTSAENVQKGVDLLRQAIGGFRDVLEMDPAHAGSQKNLAIVQLRIKTLLDQLKRLREEAAKKAKEDQDKKDPVELLKELIAEEKAEIELTQGAASAGVEIARLDGYRDRLKALPPGAHAQTGLHVQAGPEALAELDGLAADPGLAAGGAEVSEARKLLASGDRAGADARLAAARERVEKETAERQESRKTALEKDQTDQSQTLAKSAGLARGLRDAAEGKPPPPAPGAPPDPGAAPHPAQPPPPEVAERLVVVAEHTEEAVSQMGKALGALGPAASTAASTTPTAPAAPAAPPDPAAPDNLSAAETAQKAALEALEKALAEAEKLPKQEPPPQENQDQQKDQKDQKDKKDKQDEKKDGQKKDDSEKKDDSKKKDADKKDGKKDADKKDTGKKEGEKKDDQKKDGEGEAGQKKDEKKMSPEEAKEALRRFLEKDAEKRRDRERRAQAGGPGRAALDKDW